MIYENTRVYYNTTLFTSLINNVIEIKNIGCVWQKNDNETNMKNNFTIFTFKILLLLLCFISVLLLQLFSNYLILKSEILSIIYIDTNINEKYKTNLAT